METQTTVTAIFSSRSRSCRTAPIYQYDIGDVLTVAGIDLPAAAQVHFSNTENGESKTSIMQDGQVTIPQEYTQSGKPVYAWLYLVGEESGSTKLSIVIPVFARAKITDHEPSPDEQSAIDQTIAALNRAVEQTAADVVSADASAQAAQTAQAAAETAQTAAETAAQQAADVQSDVFAARDAAIAAKTAAETAQAQAGQSAQSASESASSAATEAENAAESAQTAMTAQASAETAKSGAETARSGAETAQAAAEAALENYDEMEQSVSELKSTIDAAASEESGQQLLNNMIAENGLTESALQVIGMTFDNLPQDESAVDIRNALALEAERLDTIYDLWLAEKEAN